MKQNIKLKGQLKLYLQWPVVMTVLLVIMNIWIYLVSRRAGMIVSAFVAIHAIVAGVLHIRAKSLALSDLVKFAGQCDVLQNTLLRELSVPYAILTDEGKLVWINDDFKDMIGEDHLPNKHLNKYIPQLTKDKFPKSIEETAELEVAYDGKEYIAKIRFVPVDGFIQLEQVAPTSKGKEHFVAVSLQDITDLNFYIKENEKQKLAAGLIYIDNYDEVMESVEEVRESLLVALIERKINHYISRFDGIVKKMENDKYFIIMKKESFHLMEEDKFSILEDVKSVTVGNTVPATLSLGLGVSAETYTASNNYARMAIDLALGRGGDQAVIKHLEGITYYGGKREQTSKRTRVKARVKAEALRELIMTKDQVLIMGHKIADMDSFGAAIGIYRAAAALERNAHIIMNDITSSVRPLYDMFVQDSTYPDNMFLTSNQVEEYMGASSLLVVVDTNRKELTDCEILLNEIQTVVVLDHHRQGGDLIDNAVLSYIEPYASSTCEMVAEILQYIVEGIRISNLEASSLYAGIMIDTNNFMNRTGVRTFEAAAFLRRCGADITFVRKLFREDMNAYRIKAEIVSNAEVFKEEFAISAVSEFAVESPTIVGAQAANELLNIEKIKASFVLTEYQDKIYISARAIDEVNVQIIMEQMGGGGHFNTAGTQVSESSMDEVIDDLKAKLTKMLEEGEI